MRLSGSLTFAAILRSSQVRTRTVKAISQGLTAKTVMVAGSSRNFVPCRLTGQN